MACTTFSDGFVLGRSTSTTNVSEWIAGDFDVGFFSSSWDRRSVCIIGSTNMSCETSILALFDQRDEHGLRDTHDPVLREYLEQHSAALVTVAGRSVDTDAVWGRFQEELIRIAGRHRRPLRVYVDLTTFPRFYALGVFGLCVRSGLASRVTLGYAEGSYPKRDEDRSVFESFPFTSGRWTTISVPYLSGEMDAQKAKFYYISVGFEGAKTMRVVMREDPDRISILFPKPGFRPDYENLAAEANHELIERRRVPPSQIVYAPAADAIQAWKSMSEAALERFEQENTYYLCCGTKPHSLAFALRALVKEKPALLYNVPEHYNVVDVAPSGVFWRFDIDDLSSI